MPHFAEPNTAAMEAEVSVVGVRYSVDLVRPSLRPIQDFEIEIVAAREKQSYIKVNEIIFLLHQYVC